MVLWKFQGAMLCPPLWLRPRVVIITNDPRWGDFFISSRGLSRVCEMCWVVAFCWCKLWVSHKEHSAWKNSIDLVREDCFPTCKSCQNGHIWIQYSSPKKILSFWHFSYPHDCMGPPHMVKLWICYAPMPHLSWGSRDRPKAALHAGLFSRWRVQDATLPS